MIVNKFKSPPLIRFALAIYLTSLFPILSPAQQKQAKKINVAVLDFDARIGLLKGEAASLSDVFQSQLVETGEFVVIDRARINEILVEQGFQQTEACSQVECIVAAGKILKVEKMFAGVVSKLGKTFTVNIQLIDIATAQIQLSKSRQHAGEIDDLVSDVIPSMAADMASELLGKKVTARVSSSGGASSWFWYVGGALVAGGAAYIVLGKKSTATAVKPTALPDPSPFP